MGESFSVEIEARGRNGWFKVDRWVVRGIGDGDVSVAVYSKRPVVNVAPVYFTGPKDDVLSMLQDIVTQLEGKPDHR